MADKRLMVDTSILIDYFRKTDKIKTRLVLLSERYSTLCISSITEFEIFNGATSDQIDFWNDIIAGFVILPFDSSAARSAVNIQNRLLKSSEKVLKRLICLLQQ